MVPTGLIPVGLLLLGVTATVEGIASAWLNPRGAKAKVLIIGGVFMTLVAASMIKKSVLGY